MASQPISDFDLRRQVALVARKAKGWLLALGASATAIGFIAAALACGALDYLLRFDEPLLRLALTLASPLAAISAAWLFLWPALRAPFSESETAKRLERFFPALRGRLANALEFLRAADDDHRAGSSELRRGVVAETSSAVRGLPLDEAIDARFPKASVLLAGLFLAVLATLALAAPGTLTLGVRRLAAPFGDDVWPRRHRLQFVDPVERIAAGDDVELTAIDKNGRLPGDLRLEYRLGKGELQSAAMKPGDNPSSRANSASFRIENVSQSLVYRAVGGDDLDGPWRRVEAAPRVRVSSLEVTVFPPAYTGLPARPSTTSIRAVQGSRIELAGVANQRLSSATLILEVAGKSREIKLELAGNGQGFFTRDRGGAEAALNTSAASDDEGGPWRVEDSGSWRLRLVNRQGIGLGAERERREQGAIQAFLDEPPTIALGAASAEGLAARDEPAFDADFATAGAAVPLSAIVKDDFGIAAVRVEYRIAAPPGAAADQSAAAEEPIATPPVAIELYSGPQPPTPFENGQELAIEHSWELSQVEGLAPGQAIVWKLVAEDYLGQVAAGAEQTLTILTADEVESRLRARRKRLVASLQDTLRAQLEARSQTANLSASSEAEMAPPAAEALQRAARERSADVAAQAKALRGEYDRNRLDNVDAVGRLQSLESALDSLLAVEFASAEAKLAELARAAALADEATAAPASEAVASILADQDRIASALNEQLAELEQWTANNRLKQELSELRNEQAALLERTSRLRLETLGDGAAVESREPETARLAEEQGGVSSRFDRLQSRMEELGGQASAGEEGAALQAARRTGLSELLRRAAQALGERRFGEAEVIEKQALDAMNEILSLGDNGRESQSAGEASNDNVLVQFAARLAATIDEQKALIAESDAAIDSVATRWPELADKQATLGERTRELAASFNDAQAIQFAVVSASDAMQRAADDWRREAALDGRRAAQAALDRLEQLRSSLESSKDADSTDTAAGEAASGEEPKAPDGEPSAGDKFLLAQLKFLLAAQQALSQRTRELESSSSASPEALAELAAEQETLARLIGKLGNREQRTGDRGEKE